GAGDHGCSVADGVDRDPEELELLVVREGWALAGRARDDKAVGAVVRELVREPGEAVEVDRAVRTERRHDRGQDLAEHPVILRLWLPTTLSANVTLSARSRFTRARIASLPSTPGGKGRRPRGSHR